MATKLDQKALKYKAIETTGTPPNLEITIPREDYNSLVDQKILIKVHADCSGPVTLNINGLGAKPLMDGSNQVNSLSAGEYLEVIYNGTEFTWKKGFTQGDIIITQGNIYTIFYKLSTIGSYPFGYNPGSELIQGKSRVYKQDRFFYTYKLVDSHSHGYGVYANVFSDEYNYTITSANGMGYGTSNITSASYDISNVTWDSNYFYYYGHVRGTGGNVEGFRKCDINTFQTVIETTTIKPNDLMCDDVDDFLYGLRGTELYKINKNDLSLNNTITFSNNINNIKLNDNFVFVIENSNVIHKIDRNNFVITGSYTSASTIQEYEVDESYIYINNTNIEKVDIQNMTLVTVNDTTLHDDFLLLYKGKIFIKNGTQINTLSLSDLSSTSDKFMNFYGVDGTRYRIYGRLINGLYIIYDNGFDLEQMVTFLVDDNFKLPQISNNQLFIFFDGDFVQKKVTSDYNVV